MALSHPQVGDYVLIMGVGAVPEPRVARVFTAHGTRGLSLYPDYTVVFPNGTTEHVRGVAVYSQSDLDRGGAHTPQHHWGDLSLAFAVAQAQHVAGGRP